jgi:hypothetical protein
MEDSRMQEHILDYFYYYYTEILKIKGRPIFSIIYHRGAVWR